VPDATVCDEISGCPSDHSLTRVECGSAIGPGATLQAHQEIRGVQVFEWQRDGEKWKEALLPVGGLAKSLTSCWQAIVGESLLQPPCAALRRGAVIAVQTLFDVTLGCAGHAAGLLCSNTTSTSKSQKASRPRGMANFILRSARSEVEDLRRQMEARSASTRHSELQEAIAVQDKWLALAERAKKNLGRPLLHASWLQAAQAGDKALQRWFTAKPRYKPPNYRHIQIRKPLQCCNSVRKLAIWTHDAT